MKLALGMTLRNYTSLCQVTEAHTSLMASQERVGNLPVEEGRQTISSLWGLQGVMDVGIECNNASRSRDITTGHAHCSSRMMEATRANLGNPEL